MPRATEAQQVSGSQCYYPYYHCLILASPLISLGLCFLILHHGKNRAPSSQLLGGVRERVRPQPQAAQGWSSSTGPTRRRGPREVMLTSDSRSPTPEGSGEIPLCGPGGPPNMFLALGTLPTWLSPSGGLCRSPALPCPPLHSPA